MNYFFHPDAAAELENSISYYEECSKGLGYEFALEIYSAVQRILSHPKAWPILDGNIRRCQTRRFPYGVLYAIEGDDKIYILAVMHLHRKPGYWKDRL